MEKPKLFVLVKVMVRRKFWLAVSQRCEQRVAAVGSGGERVNGRNGPAIIAVLQ